jgi:hypothetical protein
MHFKRCQYLNIYLFFWQYRYVAPAAMITTTAVDTVKIIKNLRSSVVESSMSPEGVLVTSTKNDNIQDASRMMI